MFHSILPILSPSTSSTVLPLPLPTAADAAAEADDDASADDVAAAVAGPHPLHPGKLPRFTSCAFWQFPLITSVTQSVQSPHGMCDGRILH